MNDKRLTPEELLLRAEEEERKQSRGKLKIFLGAAPGVGKTYTMLQDAWLKRQTNLDVVIGIVESHGRKEIETLLQGLTLLSRRTTEYHGKTLQEFDLDQALARQPALILVDEMAHTNVPGSRHPKRWQDIKELIDRGIDVYTTLNVQHIESLNDVVAQITSTRIRETVPDSMLELADTIELVDLPPEDLLKRLQEGKVYIPQQAELALQHFFRKENLIALRELALRVTAEKVNTQGLSERRDQAVLQTWPTAERLLVCVGPGANATKLVRAARRMAANLHAEWIAVYVEAPRLRLSEKERQSAIQNLRLAEQLGADTLTLNGRDVVNEIVSVARSRNVTKIVIGKQIRPRWKDLLFGSLVDELVRASGEIDIYIIRGDEQKTKQSRINYYKPTTRWPSYFRAIFILGLATLINFGLFGRVALSNLIMVYLLAVVIVAIRGQRGPALLASIVSVLSYDFFFIPPRFSFNVTDTEYFFTLFVMLVVAQIISHLAIITRQQADIARLREQRTAALHALSRQLASTRGLDKLLTAAVRYVGEVFGSKVVVLLPNEQNNLVARTAFGELSTSNEKEQSVAQWVFSLGQMAGLGTDTLPFSNAIYLPLIGSSQKPIGVLMVQPEEPKQLIIPEQMQLLESCANQIALTVEVDRLQEEARKAKME